MQSTHPKPILNTSLPAQFRQIRIELAREPGHPEGDTGVAYVFIAPLKADDRIDPTLWREHREACRIARLRPDRPDDHGHLVHRPGGGWAFTTSAASVCRTRSGFTSRMNVSFPANMSRSTRVARCTPTASYRYRISN
jgi:hypothetical protein